MNKQQVQEAYTKTLTDWRAAVRRCDKDTITRLEFKLSGLRARLASFEAGEKTERITPITGTVRTIEVGEE